MRPCLGADFFDELLEQYETNTLTPENAKFVNDYFLIFLAWYTFYHALVFIQFRAENKAVIINYDNSSTASSQTDFRYMRNEIEMQVKTRKKNISQFLKENSTDYPLFNLNRCDCLPGCKNVYPINI